MKRDLSNLTGSVKKSLMIIGPSHKGSGNSVHTQTNHIKGNRNQIVFNIFRLIWDQTELHLVQIQTENGKYNQNLVWINQIQKRFLCV